MVAVVTGGWKGIGRAIAEGLSSMGQDVAVLDVDPAVVRISQTTAVEGAGRLVGFITDVSDPAGVDQAFAALQEQLGPVGVLVNNAGL